MTRSGRSAHPGAGIIAALALALASVVGCDRPPPPPAATAAAAPADRPDEASILAAVEAVEHYLAGEDYASAEVVAARLAEHAADDARARELHGRVLLSRALAEGDPGRGPGSRMDRAYREYDAAAALEPAGAGLHQNAGSIASMLGRPEIALEHYLAAERIDPVGAQHPLYAAQVLISLERYAEARAALQRALAIAPDEPVAHGSLAVVALEQQRTEEARERIGRARSLAPEDLELRLLEARILRRTGAPQRAMELLIGLGPAVRAQEPVARELALACSAAGAPRRAADAWLHRYRSRSDEPEIWRAALHAADALIDAGDREEASRWLGQARAVAPADRQVRDVEARLAAGG